jgi:16S rRNA (cytidine1402-2'-O)-methyltransferase
LEHLERGTHAFYCPGRDLDVVLEELGDAHVFVAREMTKIYEQSLSGEASKIAESLRDVGALKGEAVLLVDVPARQQDVDDGTIRSDLRALIQSGSSTRDASVQVAQALDLPRRRVYRLALEVVKDE